MSLGTIAEIPESPADMQRWSFCNQASHRDIIRVIFQLGGTRLDEYVLDPFDPENLGNWPNLHQTMHDQMNHTLGIGGFDLTGVDWSEPKRMAAWIQAHSNEHYRVSQILNLG